LSAIVLSETWLKDEIKFIQIPGYNAYHSTRKNKGGGGVTVLIKNCLSSSLQEKLTINNDTFESVGVEINSLNEKFSILGVYRPPSSSISNFNDVFFPLLNQHIARRKCVIIGDFNVNTLSDNPTLSELKFIDNFIADSYFPLINLPTRETDRTSSCIDHIYTNSHGDFTSGVTDFGITDHYSIFCLITISDRINDKKQIQFRDNSDENVRLLRNKLIYSLDIFKNFDDFGIDDRFQIFSNILHDNYSKCCPIKAKTLSHKTITHPWITDHLKRCLDEKHRLRRISYSNPSFKTRYKEYSNTLKEIILKAQQDFFKSKFDSIKNDSKKTWKYINQLIKSKSRHSITELKENGILIDDPEKIAKKFNEYFTNVASDLDNQIPVINDDPLKFISDHNSSFFFSPCTSQEIENCIKSFKSKNCSVNQIPTSIFKNISDIIAPALSDLINKSVMSGIFPSCLKISRVTPIHKKGDKFSVKNYRPIST